MTNVAVSNRHRFYYYPLLLLLAAGIGLFVTMSSYDWQGMVIVVGGVGILAVIYIPRLAHSRADSFIFSVLIWGLILRLVFAMINYWFGFYVYGGTADASLYYHTGLSISGYLKGLNFDQVTPYLKFGTPFVELFTGLITLIIGPTLQGGYLVFAFLSFLGSYYFYQAFRTAFPESNKLFYALLVFFYPSILFWSSSIGKDALIFLCLGVFAYGGAQLTRDRIAGILPVVIGLLGVLYIRPHIAAVAVIAFIGAFLVHGVGKKAMRPATFIIGLLVVGVLAWLILPRILDFLGIEELSPQGVLSVLEQQQGFSSTGGSAFTVTGVNNPVSYLGAVITLFFRPFPWEVNNMQAMAESLEGLLILGLILWQIKGIGRALRSSISDTFIRFILILFVGFIIYTTLIANFGIMVRERVMFWPFFFMLIAYAPFRRERAEEMVTL